MLPCTISGVSETIIRLEMQDPYEDRRASRLWRSPMPVLITTWILASASRGKEEHKSAAVDTLRQSSGFAGKYDLSFGVFTFPACGRRRRSWLVESSQNTSNVVTTAEKSRTRCNSQEENIRERWWYPSQRDKCPRRRHQTHVPSRSAPK